MADFQHANHNPVVTVNGEKGTSPIMIEAEVGRPLTLDASGSRDPDGQNEEFLPVFSIGTISSPLVVYREDASRWRLHSTDAGLDWPIAIRERVGHLNRDLVQAGRARC